MRRSRLESARRRTDDVLFRNTRNAALPGNIQRLLTGDGCAREFVLCWARGVGPVVMVLATERLRGSCPGARAAWGHLADNCRVTACLVHSVPGFWFFFSPAVFFFFCIFSFFGNEADSQAYNFSFVVVRLAQPSKMTEKFNFTPLFPSPSTGYCSR